MIVVPHSRKPTSKMPSIPLNTTILTDNIWWDYLACSDKWYVLVQLRVFPSIQLCHRCHIPNNNHIQKFINQSLTAKKKSTAEPIWFFGSLLAVLVPNKHTTFYSLVFLWLCNVEDWKISGILSDSEPKVFLITLFINFSFKTITTLKRRSTTFLLILNTYSST